MILARTRKTGHFFRFFSPSVFFFGAKIGKFFRKWRARQGSNLRPPALEAEFVQPTELRLNSNIKVIHGGYIPATAHQIPAMK